MQAVVLSAGKGTRLRPLTEDKPKALVEIDGRPIIEDVFDNLLEAGADELIVVVGYLKEKIINRYGDSYRGVPITYAHQREQHEDAKERDVRHIHANVTTAHELLNHKPTTAIRESVSRFVDWYPEDLEWYEPLVRESQVTRSS